MIAACVTDDCDGTNCACDCHDPQDTDNRKEPRMSDIFHDLEHEWHYAGQHVSDWFRHHGDTITAGPSSAPGATVSLAAIVSSIETRVREGEAALGAILQEHLPQAATLASLIETNPIFTSVEGALHVPQPVLNGIAKMLDELAAAYPRPGDAPAAPAVTDVAPEPAEQAN